MGVYDHDLTPNNNTTISGIDIDENNLPSTINNAIRQHLSDVLAVINDAGAKATTTGSANSQALATESSIQALADGIIIGFIAGYSNTSSTVLNVDTLGAKAIVKAAGTALAAGDLVAGAAYLVVYDASQGSGSWMLLNPSTVTTNANLTGEVTSVGNAAVLGSFTKSALTAAVSDGTPSYVGDTPLTEQSDATWEAGTGTTPSIVAPDAIAAAIAALTTSVSAASQAQMEAASDTTVMVTPGRQNFHPAHPKFFAFIDAQTGTPVLDASYNMTSITDTATGRVTLTIATDFSSADWCCLMGVEVSTTSTGDIGDVNRQSVGIRRGTQAAGTVEIIGHAVDASNGSGQSEVKEPYGYHVAGIGDQA